MSIESNNAFHVYIPGEEPVTMHYNPHTFSSEIKSGFELAEIETLNFRDKTDLPISSLKINANCAFAATNIKKLQDEKLLPVRKAKVPLRIKKEETWKKVEVKNKRNSGKEYVSRHSKTVVPARKIGESCSCQCFSKVGLNNIELIFDNFWKLGSYDLQNMYLSKLVRSKDVKRSYVKGRQSRTSRRLDYSAMVGDEKVSVCRKAFYGIHGISEKRVRSVIDKTTSTGTVISDQRGKKESSHKVHHDRKTKVKQHMSTPTMSSLCTKSPHCKNLPLRINVKSLYSMYLKWLKDNYPGEEPVTMRYYRDVFNSQFNVELEQPCGDTVNVSDEFDVSITIPANKSNNINSCEKIEDDKSLNFNEAKASKRIKREETWKKVDAKNKRNLGKEYVSRKTKSVVPAREIGKPCNCQCFLKVGLENIQLIFDNFWKLGSNDLQNVYLSKLAVSKKVKRSYVKGRQSRTSRRLDYTVEIKNKKIGICRKSFYSIHGISEKRVRSVINKITSTGSVVTDQRGKKESSHKIHIDRRIKVKEHIMLMPATPSSYGGFTIKSRYTMYLEWLQNNYPGQEPVTMRYYRDVFTTECCSIKEPSRNDTHTFCEKTDIPITNPKHDSSVCASVAGNQGFQPNAIYQLNPLDFFRWHVSSNTFCTEF